MAGVSDKQLEREGAWPAGIDNMSPETALTRSEDGKRVIALRDAENVDLRRGWPARRGGYALALAGARVHSLWRGGAWPFALYADNGTLRGYRGGTQAFDIASGLLPGAPVSYALAGERVFWTNGTQNRVVKVDGTSAPWGCECPRGQPVLTAVAGAGGLTAGRYQVAITYALATGEESGTPEAVLVDVPEGGGIALSAIPQPTEADVVTVRVYMSPSKGDELLHRTDLPVGTTTAMLGAGRLGRPLDTQHLVRMGAGRYVRLHASRLFVLTSAGELSWSETLRYGLTHPVNNRIRFAAGELLEAVGQGTPGAGLYLADGKRTYFLAGEPKSMTPTIAYPYGAVPGTGVVMSGRVFGYDDATEVAYWMARNGVGVVGLPGGQVIPQRDKQVVAPLAKSGASLLREQDGTHQVVTALAGTRRNTLAMGDRLVVTVERYDQQ